ncbi:hypothetical protein SAMN05216238_10147 [Lentibacillus persicus]|uniref:Cytochrome c oxidase subunit IIa family protein n=1 Tax=Lentibacillus persicus TaxID=640948 RepID=A0A1I1RTX6_9BACI|nr:cytochrome c oxidase subunit 2A [Lentibacillus persicus]SFD37512.1 hypothetical protein SAMN05216238_10147 [Lentibacillus persicus]
MEDVKKNVPEQEHNEDEKSLKGTFASVMLLAGFLIASWAGVFLLFMDRV